MKIERCQQQSPEWWDLKCGRISGTRFSQATSSRENRLKYDLLNETLDGIVFPDDFQTEEMIFGTENEPIARDLYIKQTGIKFEQVGAIMSDFSEIHMASPDGLDEENGRVLEIKCTRNGAIHMQRFFEGVDPQYKPQIKNYFAVSDEIKEVHFISYCPFRPERPLIAIILTRADFMEERTLNDAKLVKDRTRIDVDTVIESREQIKSIESELKEMKTKYLF